MVLELKVGNAGLGSSSGGESEIGYRLGKGGRIGDVYMDR